VLSEVSSCPMDYVFISISYAGTRSTRGSAQCWLLVCVLCRVVWIVCFGLLRQARWRLCPRIVEIVTN
jgi:hypothetical protein